MMKALVIGGSSSGKSAYAESLLKQAEQKIYIATMQPFGGDAQTRIARHRALRADKGFATLERFTSLHTLSDADLPLGSSVLLECLGNLTANTLFSERGEAAEHEILSGIGFLERRCRNVVVVSNAVFSDGIAYDPQTQRYLALLGRLNAQLAARFDVVTEVVCGIALTIKGEGP